MYLIFHFHIMLRRNMWESECHYLCDTFIIIKVRSEYLLTSTKKWKQRMSPAILLQSELVNENYIMHVFTHLNSIEISRSPQTSPSALMQNVLSDRFMLTQLKRPRFYVSCRRVQSTENFNSNSNCDNSKQASLTLIFYWVIRSDKILSLMTIAHYICHSMNLQLRR